MFSQILDHARESIAVTCFEYFGIHELFDDQNTAARSIFPQESKLCNAELLD